MAEPAVISIRRQVVDVELQGTQSDGLALQRRLPGVCADTVSPALEEALAALDPGDEYVSIDRLEIAVTDIRLDRLEEDLADAVQREVTLYLRAHPPVPTDNRAEEGSADAASGPVRRRSRVETVDEALIVFLRSGRLPWSFRLP
ncbi:MAG: contractile injection system tape measure protein, partial [Mycetocola sp.]